jgi:hypothetical protein
MVRVRLSAIRFASESFKPCFFDRAVLNLPNLVMYQTLFLQVLVITCGGNANLAH